MEGLILKMKQISSLITTNPKEINLSMSMRLTETGLGTQLSSSQIDKAVTKLTAVNNPQETDSQTLSTLQSYQTYPPKISYSFGKNSKLINYDAEYKTLESANKAHTEVLSIMVGLSIQELVKRLLHLSTLTQKPFNESASDLSLRIKSLAERLSIFPADAVIKSIEKLSLSEKYFPVAFSQYYEHIEPYYSGRKVMLNNVVKQINKLESK